MDSHCKTAAFAVVIFCDHRQCGGNVKGFTYSHQGAEPVDLVISGAMSHEQGDRGPDAQRAGYQPFFAYPVCDCSGERAYESVYPEEYSHKFAEIHGGFQLRDIYLHGIPHGGQHLPVHVIQKSYHPQQPDDYPWINPVEFFSSHYSLIFNISEDLTPGFISPPATIMLFSIILIPAPASAVPSHCPSDSQDSETGSKNQTVLRKR